MKTPSQIIATLRNKAETDWPVEAAEARDTIELIESLVKDAELGRAVNRVCTFLPNGWGIELYLENGSGSLVLLNANRDEYCDEEGSVVEFAHADTFARNINDAVDAATYAVLAGEQQ